MLHFYLFFFLSEDSVLSTRGIMARYHAECSPLHSTPAPPQFTPLHFTSLHKEPELHSTAVHFSAIVSRRGSVAVAACFSRLVHTEAQRAAKGVGTLEVLQLQSYSPVSLGGGRFGEHGLPHKIRRNLLPGMSERDFRLCKGD